MKVCAIVLDYRGAPKTEICLASLIGEEISRVLVVDNSDDAQYSEMLQAVVDRLRKVANFDIIVLRKGINFGFSRGVNLAINADLESDNPHDAFFLLNNDAEICSGVISALISELDDASDVDLVAPIILDASGRRQGMMWYHRFFGTQSDNGGWGKFPFLSGCCLLVRASVVRDGKLFDPSFFMYGEDVQLGWRMMREGRGIRCVEHCLVKHQNTASSSRGELFYEFHTARAHILLAAKTLCFRLEFPLMILIKMLSLTGRALVRCVRYRSATPVLGLLMALAPLDVDNP